MLKMLLRLLAAAMILACAAAGRADADRFAPLFEPFDARPLDAAERRVLQAGLAVLGHYRGTLDGRWGSMSQRALEAYARAETGDVEALNLHAALVIFDLVEAIEQSGWDYLHLPAFGIALALPLAEVTALAEPGGGRRWTGAGLSVRVERQSPDAVDRAHRMLEAETTDPAGLYRLSRPDLRVTKGRLAGGEIRYIRSDWRGGGWTSVHLLAAPWRAEALTLVAASITPGPVPAIDLPPTGHLARLFELVLAFGLDLAEAPVPPAPPPNLPPGHRPDAAARSGSGFFVGPWTLVTAEHVVAGCHHLALGDGTPLTLLASDAALDLAVLLPHRPAAGWLALAPARDLRLGERVHALGYPYLDITGIGLTVTGGNISALAGVGGDRRFLTLSAPVQPGNSGGPLIDAEGSVAGVVIARLSDTAIVDRTGSLPQNMNFAVSHHELAAFLRRAGTPPAEGGIVGYAIDHGLPAEAAAAVLPVLCEG